MKWVNKSSNSYYQDPILDGMTKKRSFDHGSRKAVCKDLQAKHKVRVTALFLFCAKMLDSGVHIGGLKITIP